MCFHILINDLACHSFALGRFFINLAGLPPQISFGGIFFVTIAPAATIELSPISTLLQIILFAPIKQACPIFTTPNLNLKPGGVILCQFDVLV